MLYLATIYRGSEVIATKYFRAQPSCAKGKLYSYVADAFDGAEFDSISISCLVANIDALREVT
ncbi:hypothetical protein LCGC14_1890920 [marine sediment metagenome]|uniref:Uncharacterized protein n=1 Tax=marine sediment metagenome TaxID=412755 RepID=A0A0F9IDF2_9ZZZZ